MKILLSSIANRAAAAALAIVLLGAAGALRGQDKKISSFDRERAKEMLKVIEDDIKKNYYDPKFHGFDLEARFDEARKKIDSASSMNYALADIAAAVAALNDSHTSFIPPPRPYEHSYGWRMQAVGDSDCFITAVRPGTDAAKKGIQPGDQVISVDGHPVIREDLWKIDYVYNVLRPQPGLRLVLRSPDGNTRQVDAMAFIRNTKQVVTFTDLWTFTIADENSEHLRRPRYAEFGRQAIVLKLHDFEFDPEHVGGILDKVRKYDALILDLRGNPGGYIETAQRLLGGMFEQPVKIADHIGRKETKVTWTKPDHGKTFTGKLIVLVDSKSASAAEIFARVIQVQKRGIVLGDRSSGMVMESKFYPHQAGADIIALFGATITDADLIMTDGKSLEHEGVMPDERILPSAADLAADCDPVLARAADLAGVKLSPEEAGKLFPVEWPPE